MDASMHVCVVFFVCVCVIVCLSGNSCVSSISSWQGPQKLLDCWVIRHASHYLLQTL